MGSVRNQQEIKQHCVDNMPPGLGERYHKLQYELSWLHTKWADFRELLASGQETVDLLNATAATYFADIHRMLLESILLHLCRMTDRPNIAGHATLTVRSLGDFLSDEKLKADLAGLVEEANKTIQFARDWRDQQIAHSQLDRALGNFGTPLPPITCQSIEDALEALRNVLNFLSKTYLDGETQYKATIRPHTGVSALLKVLKAGGKSKLPRKKQ